MEGLKLIAQSTFDRHQKFRPAGEGQPPYRYNVIEIAAFGAPSTQASLVSPTSTTGATSQATGVRTLSKRQSVGSLQQHKSGASGSGAGTTHLDGSGTSRTATYSATKRVTLNEWMVHEDDLVAFMKKRPVEIIEDKAARAHHHHHQQQQQQQPQPQQATGSTTTTSNSTARLSQTFSDPSSTSKLTENTSTATNTDNRNATASKRDRAPKSDEVEAVAWLKLICIPRAAPPDLSDSATSGISGDFPSEGGPSNALAISREAFLRLYVDQMDADHCALYYLAREYDGFHEWNDYSRGIVTKFVGTTDYALIWTFNRRTLETKGLFVDRYHRWQPPDSSHIATNNVHHAPTSGFGSAPVTPSNRSIRQESGSATTTPSNRWKKRQTGSVSSSLAWTGFRDTLKLYRKYIYAPQLLSFVCCIHMLRTYDDEVNEDDLPSLRNIEANLGAFQQQQQLQQQQQQQQQHPYHHHNHHREESRGSDAGDDMVNNRLGGFMRAQSSSFAFISQQQQSQQTQDPFENAPITPPPPGDGYTNSNHAHDRKDSIPNLMTPSKLSLPPLLDTEKLAFQARATNRVDTSLANKLRHLKVARNILELLARDHETVIVDVVAPAFLDRYHWTMEAMTEAIPALERHIGSLEEYLGYLKGRAERLTGLISLAASSSPPIGTENNEINNRSNTNNDRDRDSPPPTLHPDLVAATTTTEASSPPASDRATVSESSNLDPARSNLPGVLLTTSTRLQQQQQQQQRPFHRQLHHYPRLLPIISEQQQLSPPNQSDDRRPLRPPPPFPPPTPTIAPSPGPPNSLATATAAFMPAIFSVGIIVIVSLSTRSTFIMICIVMLLYAGLTLTQRRWSDQQQEHGQMIDNNVDNLLDRKSRDNDFSVNPSRGSWVRVKDGIGRNDEMPRAFGQALDP